MMKGKESCGDEGGLLIGSAVTHRGMSEREFFVKTRFFPVQGGGNYVSRALTNRPVPSMAWIPRCRVYAVSALR